MNFLSLKKKNLLVCIILVKELNFVYKLIQRYIYLKLMSKFRVELIRGVMEDQDNIRNMSVIAHVDHGKSTLTDALICKAGLISQDKAGEARWTDKDELEKDKGITIKSTGVSMCFDYREN